MHRTVCAHASAKCTATCNRQLLWRWAPEPEQTRVAHVEKAHAALAFRPPYGVRTMRLCVCVCIYVYTRRNVYTLRTGELRSQTEAALER